MNVPENNDERSTPRFCPGWFVPLDAPYLRDLHCHETRPDDVSEVKTSLTLLEIER